MNGAAATRASRCETKGGRPIEPPINPAETCGRRRLFIAGADERAAKRFHSAARRSIRTEWTAECSRFSSFRSSSWLEAMEKRQIFPAGLTIKRTPLKYTLEQFAELREEEVEPQDELVDLAVGLHVHALWNNTVEQNWKLYEDAAGNLRKAAPNLRILRPSGGHSYYPRNGTLRQIRCDLLLVHNSLDAITSQMRKAGWRAGDSEDAAVNYTLFHFVHSKYFIPDDYRSVLDEVFGRNVTAPLVVGADLHRIELKNRLNGVPVHLSIETFTDLQLVNASTQLEHGTVARLDLARAKEAKQQAENN
ncbi:hypothetical protein M3Y99_01379500 [Aphelenchoides fujianensis]|nr:hypothetical protein M3Y99_01379500 [Aphelenchoides fujianensis]